MCSMNCCAPQVADEESLWRRIYNNPKVNQYVPNGRGGYRVSSAAFHDTMNQLSVDIASKTTPEKCIEGPPKGDALASLKAKIPKRLGYSVVEDPIPNNPAHALILGKIRRPDKRKLAASCTWIIPPARTNNH